MDDGDVMVSKRDGIKVGQKDMAEHRLRTVVEICAGARCDFRRVAIALASVVASTACAKSAPRVPVETGN